MCISPEEFRPSRPFPRRPDLTDGTRLRLVQIADAEKIADECGARHTHDRGHRKLAQAIGAYRAQEDGFPPSVVLEPGKAYFFVEPAEARPIPEAVAEQSPRAAYLAAAMMLALLIVGLIAFVSIAAVNRGDWYLGLVGGPAIALLAVGLFVALVADGRRGRASRRTAHQATAAAPSSPVFIRTRLLPPRQPCRLDVEG